MNLVNGNIITDCNIGYRTFGKLNADKSNIIIYPSWFEGTSDGIENLISKYQFIDTNKYYIIVLDALGNGISTSPSNYHSTFPQITIRDMVNSQYKFLTEILEINHIYCAIGGSMGSMQVLEWAVAYPGFMDKVVAYSTTPKMTSYDLLWMNTQVEMIELLKKKGTSEREIKKISDMLVAMIVRTPDYFIENNKVEEFPDYLLSFDKEPSKIFTLEDYIVQIKAMMNHDISNNFNKSLKEAARIIKAKLFIIVSETDMMVNPTEAIKFADLINCKKLVLNNNCGHLAPSCELERVKDEISRFLSEN
ncbi:MAG TPA: alpha/beta fold hydrolase [Ignavibacteriaceae bacterium]|nr:alpha/beta fold hydrolase [Ignavibacteriaceae bacterium]